MSDRHAVLLVARREFTERLRDRSFQIGALKFSGSTPDDLGVVLLWFVLGFALYAWLYAIAGMIVSRQEDLQSTTPPLTLLFVVTFLIAVAAIRRPPVRA